MNTTALDVLTLIVNDQRHYFNFEQVVPLREIYSFSFWIRMDKCDLPWFGLVFNRNCQQLGFQFIGKKNGICTYRRIF